MSPEPSATSDLEPPADPAARRDPAPSSAAPRQSPPVGWPHSGTERLLHGTPWAILRLSVDLTLLCLAVLAASFGAPAAGLSASSTFEAWLLPPIAVGLLALRGSYRDTLQTRLLDRVVEVVGVVSLATMSLLALNSLQVSGEASSDLLVRSWVFAILYVAGGRVLLGVVRHGALVDGTMTRPTLIVGAGRVGAQVERRLTTHPELGLRPVGYLDSDPLSQDLLPGRQAPVLGEPSDLARVVEETGARHVIFAFLSEPDQALIPLVRECQERGLETSLVPRLFDSINSRVQLEHMGGLPLYGLRTMNPRGWQFRFKHTVGKVIAALLLVVLSPVMLLIAAAIKLTSSGPVLFRQRRIGRDGQQFDLLKFRSMTWAQDPSDDRRKSGRLRAVDDDTAPGGVETPSQRVTPIGAFIRRTSLDELPQLWNVIRGDMTLVGPRPERPEFVEIFGQSIRRYDERHRVKSGITGWAQVHGLRGRTSLADRVEWDNYYIENWSLWLDLKVLLMTLAAPFKRAE